MDNINKVINLTIEYIDQITSDGRVTSGLIKFSSKTVDKEETISMDIYVLQTNFIRHFNTHIKEEENFINALKEKINQKYSKIKDFKIEITEDKIIVTRQSSKPCAITITYEM